MQRRAITAVSGIAVVTFGAGAFNLVNAVAGAYAERSPRYGLEDRVTALARKLGLPVVSRFAGCAFNHRQK